jgi:hypothetical protein
MAYWALRPLGPVGQIVTVPQFARAISTTTIKVTDGSRRRPPSLSLL